MKRTSLRLAALAMALFTVLSLAHALAVGRATPPTPHQGLRVSEDSTIYLRGTPVKDTDGAVQLRHMEGKTVSVLGEDATGSTFIEYEGKKGFVRAKDFELTDKTPAATPAPSASADNVQYFSAPKTGMSRDSAIYMAHLPQIPAKPADSDSNVARKVKHAKGAAFSLLGESGDWYYADI